MMAGNRGSTAQCSFVRLISLLLAVWILSTCGLSAAESSETSSRDRAKLVMAERSAAKRLLEDINSMPSCRETDKVLIRERLVKTMLSDVKSHRAMSASKPICEGVVKSERWDYFNNCLTNAVSASQSHSPIKIEPAEVLKQTPNWKKEVEAGITRFIADNFQPLYIEARNSAVASQRRELDQSIKAPTFEEIDAALNEAVVKKGGLSRLTLDDFAAMKGWIQKNVCNTDKPSFSENTVYMDEIVSKVILEITDQYEGQVGILDEMISRVLSADAAVLSASLRDEAVKAIRSYIGEEKIKLAQNRGSRSVPVYDIFSSVEMEVGIETLRAERNKLISTIKSIDKLPVTSGEIEKSVIANLAEHKNIQHSQNRIFDEFKDKAGGFAVSNHMKKLAEPQRKMVQDKYFMDMLDEREPSVEFRNHVAPMLNKVLAGVREELVKHQQKQYFSWLKVDKPIAEPVLAFASDKPEVLPVKSVFAMMALFRKDEFLQFPAIADAVILDDTAEKVIAAANVALVAGRQAFTGQLLVLQEVEKEKIEKLAEEASGKKKLEDILDDWTSEVKRRWNKSPDKGEYGQLFERTMTVLNKSVRQFFDSVEKLRSEQQIALKQNKKSEIIPEDDVSMKKEDPPEDSPENMSNSDAKPVEKVSQLETADAVVIVDLPISEADCIITLADTGMSKCNVAVTTGGGEAISSVEINPRKTDESADEVHNAVKAEITSLLEKKMLEPADKFGNRDLKLFIVIKSEDVRHKMSIMLSHKVREQVESWSKAHCPDGQQIRLMWCVGL